MMQDETRRTLGDSISRMRSLIDSLSLILECAHGLKNNIDALGVAVFLASELEDAFGKLETELRQGQLKS